MLFVIGYVVYICNNLTIYLYRSDLIIYETCSCSSLLLNYYTGDGRMIQRYRHETEIDT